MRNRVFVVLECWTLSISGVLQDAEASSTTETCIHDVRKARNEKVE